MRFTNFERRPILGLDPCFAQPEETATNSTQARNYLCPGEHYFLIIARKDVHPFFRAEQCCGSGTKKDPHEFARVLGPALKAHLDLYFKVQIRRNTPYMLLMKGRAHDYG
jgi:hypothetical protein